MLVRRHGPRNRCDPGNPEVGRAVWKVGFEFAARLPCGNLAVYEMDGRTGLLALRPHYMNVVNPHPEIKLAGEGALLQFKGLRESLAK